MNMHQKYEHGGISYSCGMCDFLTKHEEDLTAHINTKGTYTSATETLVVIVNDAIKPIDNHVIIDDMFAEAHQCSNNSLQ